jgi:hypothetical protein
MNFNYEEILNKSHFTEKNFSGRFAPNTIINNFIPCSNLEDFHFLTSFFLHLYSSLYIELKWKENQYDYNISLFTELINNLKIKIVNDNTLPLSSLNNNLFIFNYIKIQNTDDYYKTSYINYNNNLVIDNLKPVFGLYPTILKIKTLSRSFINNEIHKNNINNFTYDNIQIREIIRQLLIQTPENIIGFVLYQKIYFNSILYNIDIQNSIRRNYLNNNNLIMSNKELLKPLSHQIYINIINKIDDNISNLKTITDKTFSDKEFLIEKNKYKHKINVFNNLREEYATAQDKLNISIKIYNHELINYKKIKNYATYIIIILIILMVFTIFLSIFPIYKNDTKNAIYIIIFILLLIITYLYYVNFKYMILYEKFGTDDLNENKTLINSSSCSTTLTYKSNNNNDKNNNIFFFNNLLSKINEYSNMTTDLFNDLRLNIYTIGNKSFSQDANIIINNVYLEKKRQLEINNIKLTNLFNMIEIIKKQKTYLFNFVFVIACLCLILLLGLVLYSSVPQLFTFIIILCVVLISILMIYFSFAIIQPTRMIANKNYWAITNPSKNTIGKL